MHVAEVWPEIVDQLEYGGKARCHRYDRLLPVAVTVNVAVEPTFTCGAVGWLVIEVVLQTLRIEVLLMVVPQVVTRQRNWAPESGRVTAGEYELDVALAMFVHVPEIYRCHW